jgi:hypothetical protein
LAFTAIAATLILLSNYASISVPDNLRGPLLTVKAGVVSLTIATMTFYYKTFWDSIEKLKNIKDLAVVVNYHSSSFILLFGGGLFVFLSLFVDMYALFFVKAPYLVPIFMGLMFAGLTLLFIFLLVFLGRTLGEMQSLKSASSENDLSKKEN